MPTLITKWRIFRCQNSRNLITPLLPVVESEYWWCSNIRRLATRHTYPLNIYGTAHHRSPQLIDKCSIDRQTAILHQSTVFISKEKYSNTNRNHYVDTCTHFHQSLAYFVIVFIALSRKKQTLREILDPAMSRILIYFFVYVISFI